MGKISGTPPGQFSLSRSTLDAKGETTRRGAVDLQIVGGGLCKQFFDDWLESPVRHIFLGKKAAAARFAKTAAQAARSARQTSIGS